MPRGPSYWLCQSEIRFACKQDRLEASLFHKVVPEIKDRELDSPATVFFSTTFVHNAAV